MNKDPRYEVTVYKRTDEGVIPLGNTYGCPSIRYTQNLYTPGTFTLEIPLDDRTAREFAKGRYVEIGRTFQGIIRAVRYETGPGNDMLTVSGTDLLGLIARRVTMPPSFDAAAGMAGYDAKQGATETVIKHFVKNNIESPIIGYKKIPGFVIAPDLERGTPNDKYMSRYEPLEELVGRLAKDAQIGVSCHMDTVTGIITFDVFAGDDRTESQRAVRPVIFSKQRQTITSMTYSDSDVGLRNAFYATMAGAKYEDEAFTMVYYRAEDDEHPPEGDARCEMHMDINADHPTPGMEYEELERLALLGAADYTRSASFTCDIDFTRYEYGADYFLGDMVTMQNTDWGVTMDTRLVEMTVSLARDDDLYSAVFGEQTPTFAQTVRKVIKTGG